MIRKNLHFVLMVSAMVVCNFASAQLYIDNATFFIQSGATVTVQGNVTSNADIQGTGKLLLKGSGNQDVSMSGKIIPYLEIDNLANATLTTTAKVSDSVVFTNGNLILGANNLILGAAPGGKVVTPAANKFFVTNSTGSLLKAAVGTTPFLYPVGNTAATYNPLTIANAGTVDSIGVRCLANALTQGTAGTPFSKEVVDASWNVTESVAGGSNLTLTANWATTDQLAPFNAAKVGISRYVTTPVDSVGWDLLNVNLVAASAGTPNSSVQRAGITNVGTFAVGFRPVLSPLLVAPKVFLQGPYNTGTNLMSTSLATLLQIPLTEPYTGLSGFTHSGSGGGETVANTAFFTANNIVDWVFVQLHNSTGTVVSTRSALLKNDGTIVDTDGTPLSLGGNAPGSNYYFSVRHRNHLGVRTAGQVNLINAKVNTFSYSFASAKTQALANAADNAMTNKYGSAVTTPNWMLYAGNPSLNTRVTYSGGGNDENIVLNGSPLLGSKGAAGSAVGYWLSDLNLSGKVTYSGGGNDENILLNISLLGNKTATGIIQATF